jgi:hypothetical protein
MITNTGYYSVGNLNFTEKLDAILHANINKDDVVWHFNEHIYNKINWTIEPELSLDQYYKIRAQQIRDQYDYVIILCSGGGDSTNVVWSFLNNGIQVDEIIASAPVSGLSKWKETVNDVSAGNTMSETLLAQLPLMKQIHSKHPEIKITINDYFDTLINYKTDEWIFKCGEWIHPSSSARYDLNNQPHIRKLAEQGKKIGIIYGIDKPLLFYDLQGNVGTIISDLAVNVQRPPFNDKYPNVENVLFYFAPELPEMQVKQAHAVAKWIHRPENDVIRKKMMDWRRPDLAAEQTRIKLSFYERAIIPCIYPTTYRKVFQGHKPTRIFLGEHDDWFYRMHNDTKAFELIVSDFRNFIKEIDPKYLNHSRTGFEHFRFSYIIGNPFDFSQSH